MVAASGSPPPETPRSADDEEAFVSRVMEAAIRLAVLGVLVFYTLRIIHPFLGVVLWAGILAVALHPTYVRFDKALGRRRRLSAILFTVLIMLVLVTPTALLMRTLVSGVRRIASGLKEQTIEVPPPPESVQGWPIAGEFVYETWEMASENLRDALQPFGPQLEAFGGWLISSGTGAGLALLKFMASIIVAGFLLAHAKGAARTMRTLFVRLSGPRGVELTGLAEDTIRSVARGVIGVAFIQAVAAGLGFLVVGVPGAGLWALVALLLGIIQVGVNPVTIPAAVWVCFNADTTTASFFVAWTVVVGLMDNILKPLLLGRGVKAPMVIIFVGSVGGLLAGGIIGLFVGAVILVLAHKLVVSWMDERHEGPTALAAGSSPPAP